MRFWIARRYSGFCQVFAGPERDRMDAVKHADVRREGEQAVTGIAKMARSLSHALNGTISVARGNLLLLRARLHDPESLSLLQEAVNALAQQEFLARSFTAISFRDAYCARQVTVRDFFEQSRDRFAQFVAEVSLDIADPAGGVWTDPDYLELAINALIMNAREATMSLKQPRIALLVSAVDPVHVTIAVTDNGRGISAHNAGSIFDAGFSTKNGGHAGAGLWFVSAFANAVGGGVSAAPNPAGVAGTTVVLTLPAAKKAIA